MTSISKDRLIGRIAALTLFGLSFAFGLARTGTTTITTTHQPATAYCHVCNQHGGTHSTGGTKGGGGGGGLISVSPN